MFNARIIGSILVVSFFALTLCGAGLLAAHTDGGEHVPGCPFASNMETSCPLSTIDQLSKYASVLGSLPEGAISASLILALFALASAFFAQTTLTPLRVIRREYIDDASIWRPLQLAFSRGILNPKAY